MICIKKCAGHRVHIELSAIQFGIRINFMHDGRENDIVNRSPQSLMHKIMLENIVSTIFSLDFLIQVFDNTLRYIRARNLLIRISCRDFVKKHTATRTHINNGITVNIIQNREFGTFFGIVHGIQIILFISQTVKDISSKAKHIKNSDNVFLIGCKTTAFSFDTEID